MSSCCPCIAGCGEGFEIPEGARRKDGLWSHRAECWPNHASGMHSHRPKPQFCFKKISLMNVLKCACALIF